MRVDDEPLERALEESITEPAGVFGRFYHPFLADYLQQIRQWDQLHVPEDAIDVSGVVGSLLRSTMDALTVTGARTLIAAFRAGGADPRAPMGYDEFHAWVSSASGRARVLERFPELARLLRLETARRCACARSVVRAAWQDRQQLRDAFGTDGRIASVTTGLGDSHRGGQTVSFVHWENGRSAVYKPHQRSCQQLLHSLRALVDPDASFFGPLYPESVIRPTHIWQEHIKPSGAEGHGGPARYFQRFGRVAAFLTMLGASDLHHENVIATADGPVVVDTETLVSLPLHDVGEGGALARDVEASVLNTLLFPVASAGAGLDVDVSAIGGVQRGVSQRLHSFVILDAGTDDIRFDRVPVVIANGASMATAQDEHLDPRAWVDEIVTGFGEARELLQRHRAAIEQVVAGSPGWAVRHMLRPTYVYARFLEASTHPSYLRSTADRVRLLEKLPRSHRGVGPAAADSLHREEVRALLDLDIPYFEVDGDSSQVRCNGGEEAYDTDLTTPRDAALARIRAFFARPPARDLAYVCYSLAGSAEDAVASPARPRHRAIPALTDAAGWHSWLRDLVVREEGGPTWLVPQLVGTRLLLAPVNAVLYEGGGLLLYLAQAERAGETVLPAAEIGAAYAQATPRNPPETTTPLSSSPFTGALSNLVTGLELGQRRIALPAALPALDAAAGPQVGVDRSAADFDYLNGFGGYLVYLAEYADLGAPRLAGLEPRWLLERLLEVDGQPDEHAGELGLAHGRFGRLAAIGTLAAEEADGCGTARRHVERFVSAYLRCRWTDAALGDPVYSGGWCKGYAGIAFAQAKLLRAIGHSSSEIRSAIAPEVEQVVGARFGTDISICHGVAGRLAMLCWLADRLDWPELRVEAKALNAGFIERFGDGGWSCGVGSAPALPSFLFGLSGWHYVQLMLRDPTVELPLCLGGR